MSIGSRDFNVLQGCATGRRNDFFDLFGQYQTFQGRTIGERIAFDSLDTVRQSQGGEVWTSAKHGIADHVSLRIAGEVIGLSSLHDGGIREVESGQSARRRVFLVVHARHHAQELDVSPVERSGKGNVFVSIDVLLDKQRERARCVEMERLVGLKLQRFAVGTSQLVFSKGTQGVACMFFQAQYAYLHEGVFPLGAYCCFQTCRCSRLGIEEALSRDRRTSVIGQLALEHDACRPLSGYHRRVQGRLDIGECLEGECRGADKG